MATTDRLLEKLRDALGDDATRDLIAHIAEARDVNRAEVRELAELYLSRFDERMAARFVEQDAKIELRLAKQDSKIDRLGEQMTKLESRVSALEVRVDAGFAAVRVEMADRLSTQHKDLLRWLFVFWAGTIIPLAGLMVALIKL